MKDNEKIGILITNLGSPDSFSVKSVRKYLKQFLSDTRIIEAPRLIWWPVLNLIILNTRPKKSAQAYEQVWTEDGSPLISISKSLVNKLTSQQWPRQIEIALAMRYGNPSISQGIDELMDKGIEKILVLPMYPQYSATTTASTFDAIADDLKKRRVIPELRFINHYYNETAYIDAIAKSIEKHWQTHPRCDKLIFSFHGIPQDYVKKGDPYEQHCKDTALKIAEKLKLGKNDWLLTFQSRLGPKKWLQPYTNVTLKKLAKKGTESVQLVCPGFSIDCLETIEENDEENREIFLEAGGKHFETIACLNDSDLHVTMIQEILTKHLKDW